MNQKSVITWKETTSSSLWILVPVRWLPSLASDGPPPALPLSRSSASARRVPASTAPRVRRAPPEWTDPALFWSAPSHERTRTELQHTDSVTQQHAVDGKVKQVEGSLTFSQVIHQTSDIESTTTLNICNTKESETFSRMNDAKEDTTPKSPFERSRCVMQHVEPRVKRGGLNSCRVRLYTVTGLAGLASTLWPFFSRTDRRWPSFFNAEYLKRL